MAIHLITGLPGNAKSCYAISFVWAWAKRENRPVFYSGIELTEKGEAALGWTKIDGDKWYEVPPLAIVLVDEAQRLFRNRSLGQIPGKHVTELETHRHLGIDLVFLTQHPTLIDPAIRKLTQVHTHMVRVWGFEVSTVHTWDTVRDNCDKNAARKDSQKVKWKFDKSIYPLYVSANAHTMKGKIPTRVKLLLLVPVLLAAAVWGVYSLVVKKKLDAVPKSQVSEGRILQVGQQGGAATGLIPRDPVEDAKQFVYMQTARVEGLPHTAPKYDKLTEPTRVPVPAACVLMASKNRCSCYTQQATPMNVSQSMCIEFARNGFFQEFEPNGRGNDADARQSVRYLEGKSLPLSGASTRDVGPSSFVVGAATGLGGSSRAVAHMAGGS